MSLPFLILLLFSFISLLSHSRKLLPLRFVPYCLVVPFIAIYMIKETCGNYSGTWKLMECYSVGNVAQLTREWKSRVVVINANQELRVCSKLSHICINIKHTLCETH